MTTGSTCPPTSGLSDVEIVSARCVDPIDTDDRLLVMQLYIERISEHFSDVVLHNYDQRILTLNHLLSSFYNRISQLLDSLKAGTLLT